MPRPATADTGALAVIERAREQLGLSYLGIAKLLHADETTLHRWRRDATVPSQVFVERLTVLGTLLDALRAAFPERGDAERWLATPNQVLGGQDPRNVLLSGAVGLVAGVLLAAHGSAARAVLPYDRRHDVGTNLGPADDGRADGAPSTPAPRTRSVR